MSAVLSSSLAQQINIHEAKTNLSRLVEEAMAGADIVIAKAGKPMVRLVPVEPKRQPIKLGLWEGRTDIVLPDDIKGFAREEIAAMFNSRPDKFDNL